MLSKWPIRNKLLIGLALLLVLVATLSWSGIRGLYAYRGLVKSLDRRLHSELGLASELSRQLGELRAVTTAVRSGISVEGEAKTANPTRAEFRMRLDAAKATYNTYGQQLVDASPQQLETLKHLREGLERVESLHENNDWMLDAVVLEQVNRELGRLQEAAADMPRHLHTIVHDLNEQARDEYRALLAVTWTASVVAAASLVLFVRLFYQWVFRPLRVLIKGSRRVAGGEFAHRIRLESHDEMAELAGAMNDMTARFQTVRDDLDHQVQVRTKQAVRSEQLASVGFLAAGVAHEINNPLASIALCAESLESRLDDVLSSGDDRHELVRRYLKMIQDEAFRCKEITERLLDFSRLGENKRQTCDLRSLVQSVIEMLAHLEKYNSRQLGMLPGDPVWIEVNPQEIKQVVLNVLTNALDSIDAAGRVTIEIAPVAGQAELLDEDNGCGMTPEVLEQIFEPFFTRRRNGQGTGLGLSIAYRIVADHGGSIEAHSGGPGRGSQFRIALPLAKQAKESRNRYQAA